MAFKRFFTLDGNKTVVMDGKTQEVYRTPDVRQARRLVDLLNSLDARALEHPDGTEGEQRESAG